MQLDALVGQPLPQPLVQGASRLCQLVGLCRHGRHEVGEPETAGRRMRSPADALRSPLCRVRPAPGACPC